MIAAEPGTRLHYLALSTATEIAPPFTAVDFVYGPHAQSPAKGQWWQIEIRTNAESATPPLCVVRAQSAADPLNSRSPIEFIRYQLRIAATGETLEYVDIHTSRALLPAWVDFEKYFVPHPASVSGRRDGAPETCLFLGHVLSLRDIHHGETWNDWTDAKRLNLDREMLIGTGRNFKDVEGKRLSQTPQPQDYTYTNFTAADYRTMIDAGINLFLVAPDQQPFVQNEAVFYLCEDDRSSARNHPADLYRANFLGASMFVDEPASILTWDRFLKGSMKYFSDASTLIEKRTRVTFDSGRQYYGRLWLESQLAAAGVNFGDMQLAQLDLPVWETHYDAAFYELKGGGSGIVHEGRYQSKDFDDSMAKITGAKRTHSDREVLEWYYAFLRGGARPFGKFWGTSIYGQCDPALAPTALNLAYDMGARYFWFWTSDHGHHVPWPEQLSLAHELKQYAAAHPRSSIYGPPRKTDTVITLPNGYFITLANLDWLLAPNEGGDSAESQTYHRLQRRTVDAVEQCYQRHRDFDITIEDGHPITAYRHVVKLSADP